jgi:soluble lytic murein transglycosylase-like protein
MSVGEQKYHEMISLIAKLYHLPPSWVMAICRQESNFRPDVVVKTGGDGLRGGAWGLGQMTYKTAEGLGFDGNPQMLLIPEINLFFVCKLLNQLRGRYGHDNFKDVAAAYNSGKPYIKAPIVTREKYVPSVVKFEESYRDLNT